MPNYITLDVPECKQPKDMVPTYVEIIMDETVVFKGSVNYDTVSGNALIDISKNNGKLKAVLGSNAKLAQFHFKLYASNNIEQQSGK